MLDKLTDKEILDTLQSRNKTNAAIISTVENLKEQLIRSLSAGCEVGLSHFISGVIVGLHLANWNEARSLESIMNLEDSRDDR